MQNAFISALDQADANEVPPPLLSTATACNPYKQTAVKARYGPATGHSHLT